MGEWGNSMVQGGAKPGRKRAFLTGWGAFSGVSIRFRWRFEAVLHHIWPIQGYFCGLYAVCVDILPYFRTMGTLQMANSRVGEGLQASNRLIISAMNRLLNIMKIMRKKLKPVAGWFCADYDARLPA